MKLDNKKDILLFYKKHKWDYVEKYSKRSVSGFYSWYLRLVKSLEEKGYRVHKNNYKLAKENPKYPIGLVGTPISIPKWNLPNPAILGPCMYDHPKLNPNLMKDKRFKYYILTCKWLRDVFKPYYEEACILWNAGIETDIWKDTKNEKKSIDVLVYDKIRWDREILIPLILDPIIKVLKKQNLTYCILPYGNITHDEYKKLLNKSRSMIFLCEHETQGMAYQEALSSNLPILAWDPGYWVDPIWKVYADKPIPATSVPYFSDKCGERFKMIGDFEKKFKIFWEKIDLYKPREYVKEKLSMYKSAKLYLKYYFNMPR